MVLGGLSLLSFATIYLCVWWSHGCWLCGLESLAHAVHCDIDCVMLTFVEVGYHVYIFPFATSLRLYICSVCRAVYTLIKKSDLSGNSD